MIFKLHLKFTRSKSWATLGGRCFETLAKKFENGARNFSKNFSRPSFLKSKAFH